MRNRLFHPVAMMWAMAVLATACSSGHLGDLSQTSGTMAGESGKQSQPAGSMAHPFGDEALDISVEQEIEIGGGVAVTAFRHVGAYYDDAQLNLYVTLVGKAVASASERPDLPYAFAVLKSEEVNAFAGPGGYIFITVGALRLMEDESQLAGVLAHEVGHVCARHAIKMLQRGRFLQGVLDGGAFSRPEQAEKYAELVAAVNDVLFNRGFDPRFEFEADLLGTEYAAAMGYNPWGLRQFLYKMYQVQGGKGGWFRTHPPAVERLQRLDETLPTNYADFRQQPLGRERFQAYAIRRLPSAP